MNDDRQGKLLQKVLSFEEAKQNKEQGQLKLFNASEGVVPYEMFEQFSSHMNRKYSNLQEANKEILQELQVNNKRLDKSNEKNERLATSIERLLPEIQNKIINNVDPSLRVGILAPNQKADVAVVDGAFVPSEVVYTLLSSCIVEKIGKDKFTASKLGIILKALKIKGDSTFHYEVKIGKKSSAQCYKPSVIKELYHRLKNYEKNDITQGKVLKWQSYLKPESEVIQ